ncbi:MAG: helix-turn-helix domain-containing protein [Ruminococcaceae bacterium]|nr:helix-turn-helix domain-containing protein [Oscillospiraceae bacterium]
MIFFHVFRTKHNGTEHSDFKLNRPKGTNDFLLIHFKVPVIFTLFQNTQRIPANTCILLSPEIPHAFYPDNCELVHDWIHFMPSDLELFQRLNLKINTFFTIDDPNFITVSLKKCEFELINKNEYYKELISSEVYSMLIKLKRQQNGTVIGCHAEAFKNLRMAIYRNPEQYETTVDMAKFVCLSRSRFSNLYSDFFGVSPQKDHINAKISKAKYLLSIDTLSIQEISEACGYHNVYHFIRQFRDTTGTTPGKYRNNH